MGKALELVSFSAIAPSTGAAGAAVAGDSLTIRHSNKSAKILAVWGKHQGNGRVRFTSPLLHDNNTGIQVGFQAGVNQAIHLNQEVNNQDTLSVNVSGSATAGDVENTSMLIHYEDLPGVTAELLTTKQVMDQTEDIYMPPVVITAGTSGGYSGSAAINASADAFKANRRYAVIGMTYQVTAATFLSTVRIESPDWGNLGIGIPTLDFSDRGSSGWFTSLSDVYMTGLVPVFNSSNESTTLVSVLNSEVASSITVYPVLALLGGGGRR